MEEVLTFEFLKKFMESYYIGKRTSKTVYFAGPWFTNEQLNTYTYFLELVKRESKLRKLKYNIFFPYLFKGTPNECFKADVMAIDTSDVLIAWIDYKDCGTSFEMGYAKAKGKKIYVIVENIEKLLKSKTNLMLAKSADGIIFSNSFDSFLRGEQNAHGMPEFNWEEVE